MIIITNIQELKSVAELFETTRRYQYVIVDCSTERVDAKEIKNSYPEIVFSVEESHNRLSRALNECHLSIYHNYVKDMVLRNQ